MPDPTTISASRSPAELVTRVREAAQRATPGNWGVEDIGVSPSKFIVDDPSKPAYEWYFVAELCGPDTHDPPSRWLADAEYIATVNPQTTLALCDLAESLVRARDEIAARVRYLSDESDSWRKIADQAEARVAALEGCIEQLRDFETLSFYDFKKKYGLQESPPDFEAYLVGIIDAALAATREAPTLGEGE